ncbi:hypothetical protein MKX01_016979, partial [Papaver californicum]
MSKSSDLSFQGRTPLMNNQNTKTWRFSEDKGGSYGCQENEMGMHRSTACHHHVHQNSSGHSSPQNWNLISEKLEGRS